MYMSAVVMYICSCKSRTWMSRLPQLTLNPENRYRCKTTSEVTSISKITDAKPEVPVRLT